MAYCSSPDALVGRHVRVLWPADNAWYLGTITEYLPKTGQHKVRRRSALKHEKFPLAGDGTIAPTAFQLSLHPFIRPRQVMYFDGTSSERLHLAAESIRLQVSAVRSKIQNRI